MILSNNNGTFTPVAGGNGTFIGTAAAFNAVKATLPVNTVAYITDDGTDKGDIIVEAVSIAMNHSSTSPFTEDSQSVAKTGYTAIGVAGHGHLGAAGNSLYYSFVSNNRYYFGITGPGNNTNVPVYIMYKKN